MMEVFDVALRLIGVFYMLASIAIMRNLVMDRMMDLMLSGITLKPQPPREAQRRWFWGVSGLSIGMGGAALMVLSLWSVPLFIVGLATQVIYLLWARTNYPPEDAIEEKGRWQTINAAVVYAVSTAVVIAAAGLGRFYGWLDPWALVIPVAGIAILATVGRNLVWLPKKRSFGLGGDPDDDWPEPEPRPEVKRVRLEPLWIGMNLTDLDTGEGVDPWDKIDDALATRIYNWALAFKATEDENDQRVWAEFASPEDELTHRAEGDAIMRELVAVFGEGNAEGPVYPADIRYVA